MGYQNPLSEQQCDYGLYLLEDILRKSGYDLTSWPTMACPRRNWAEVRINPILLQYLNYDQEQQCTYFHQHVRQLNHK